MPFTKRSMWGRYPISRCRLSILVAIIGIAATIFCSQSVVTGDDEKSPVTVLLLRNSQTIVGEITLKKGKYTVRTRSGVTRWIPVTQVVAACRDIRHAYEFKNASIKTFETQAHIDLAGWCLRHMEQNGAIEQIET